MTDMVERAARAAFFATVGLDNWDDLTEGARIYWRKQICASLKAAFQVTDEDAKAFFRHDSADVKWGVGDYLAPTFNEAMQALSDAALKESS